MEKEDDDADTHVEHDVNDDDNRSDSGDSTNSGWGVDLGHQIIQDLFKEVGAASTRIKTLVANNKRNQERIRELEEQKGFLDGINKLLTRGVDSNHTLNGQLVEEVVRLEAECARLKLAVEGIPLPATEMEDDD